MNYLSTVTLKEVLFKPHMKKCGGRRDLPLMILLYDSGCLCSGDYRPIRLRYPSRRISYDQIDRKRKKDIQVPLLSKTKTIIENYLKEQRILDNTGSLVKPVFLTDKGRNKPGPGWPILSRSILPKQNRMELFYFRIMSNHLFSKTPRRCIYFKPMSASSISWTS